MATTPPPLLICVLLLLPVDDVAGDKEADGDEEGPIDLASLSATI